MVINATQPGSDRRLQIADRIASEGNPKHRRHDELEEAVDQLIQEQACRRLEAATRGRLTFEGDRVVRTGKGDGHGRGYQMARR